MKEVIHFFRMETSEVGSIELRVLSSKESLIARLLEPYENKDDEEIELLRAKLERAFDTYIEEHPIVERVFSNYGVFLERYLKEHVLEGRPVVTSRVEYTPSIVILRNRYKAKISEILERLDELDAVIDQKSRADFKTLYEEWVCFRSEAYRGDVKEDHLRLEEEIRSYIRRSRSIIATLLGGQISIKRLDNAREQIYPILFGGVSIQSGNTPPLHKRLGQFLQNIIVIGMNRFWLYLEGFLGYSISPRKYYEEIRRIHKEIDMCLQELKSLVREIEWSGVVVPNFENEESDLL